MKFASSTVAATLVVAFASSVNSSDEIDHIDSKMGPPLTRQNQPAMGCEYQMINPRMLMSKYNLNISEPEHISALSYAVSGRNGLGSHSALIPEASDAGRTGALVVDGLSGDTNFPFGMLKPLITVGEMNYCEENLGEVYTGVPDGMGAYLVDDETLRIVVQSESYGPLLYETWPYFVNGNGASFTGSHVHYIDYDRAGLADFMMHDGPASEIIKGFGPASTTYYNLAGQLIGKRDVDGQTHFGAHYSNTDAAGNYVVTGVPTEADWLMQSLCSSHLEEAHQWGEGIGVEDDMYITNEEWIRYNEGSEFVGISMHAMDLANRVDYAVGAVTNTGFEKIVEINPQHTDYVILAVSGYNGAYSGFSAELEARIAEYGLRDDGKNYTWTNDICPARIYVGMKGKMEDGSDAPEDDFLARNGLRYGKLYGFAVDMSESGPTGGMFRDAFHKPRGNGETVEGKFVAIDWQWDGVVRNYRHDGAWEFQLDVPGYKGTDWKWWNSGSYDSPGSKTEHNSPDTRPGYTAFIQGSTAGYFGHYYIHDVASILDAADGIPAEFDATYYVYQGEQDISGQINLGGEGLLNQVDECPGASDATVNCDNDFSVKNTFEDIDGLEVIAAAEGLFAILQEDSGNELGERMFITKLEHDADGEELEYMFVAQSGGKYNTRMMEGVGVPAGTNPAGSSHEFSGVIDLSGMLMKDTSLAASSFMISAGDGAAKRDMELTIPISEKIVALGLQSHNLGGGIVSAFKADRGGQILAYKPDLPL